MIYEHRAEAPEPHKEQRCARCSLLLAPAGLAFAEGLVYDDGHATWVGGVAKGYEDMVRPCVLH